MPSRGSASSLPRALVTDLSSVGGDLAAAVEEIGVPSYVIDPHGVICWMNDAALRVVGDVRGRQYTSVVAPEDVRRARERFARNIVGSRPVGDSEITLISASGERVKVEISSATLSEGHHVVGVFGQLVDVEETTERAPHPALTPRQVEVLRMLERGRSTQQIADELVLSPETVRNHVRRLMRALGVHTRLEAVAVTRGALSGDGGPGTPVRAL